MISLQIHRFDLPLRHTFTIARASHDVQPTMVVQLSDGTHSGFGEATTDDYYNASYESMTKALEAVADELAGMTIQDPDEVYDRLHPRLLDHPFAECALNQAVHDLWGKQQGQPVYQLWGLDPKNNPQSNYTIAIDSIDKMVEKLKEVPDWPIYKIKLGRDNDIAVVQALREITTAPFRVDANCGWTATQAVELSGSLKELGVEFIEQPLPADDWEGLKFVHENAQLPIIADESCIVFEDVDKCQGHFSGINIKLTKCGGLTPARRMIGRARERGMKVMVGCMTESSVGISAIAQLLPMLDYVDMDGAALLSKDIAKGVVVDRGVCQYPTVNGNGVELL